MFIYCKYTSMTFCDATSLIIFWPSFVYVKNSRSSMQLEIEKDRSFPDLKEIKTKRTTESDVFIIYSQYFELMEFHSYIFRKDIKVTEADLIIKLWSPLIERVFRRSTLRTKWGESIGNSAEVTEESPGFKVDLRVVEDSLSKRRNETDISNCEVANFKPGVIKITSDRTKLIIESKIVLDNCIKNASSKTTEIAVPLIQIIGNKAILYSLTLPHNGVYVATEEGSACIPNSLSNTSSFRDVIKLLYKFKSSTNRVMEFRLKGEENNNYENNNHSNWKRGTWIPPAHDKKTRLPSIPNHLYSCDSQT